MALKLMQLHEINSQLSKVPRLVDKLARHESDYSIAVLDWLKRTESILENHRMPLASQIAAQRAMLLQADRVPVTISPAIKGKLTRRKQRDAAASAAIQKSCELLGGAVQGRQAVFDEAEKIASQIVAVAQVKGLLRACVGQAEHRLVLDCVKQQISQDPDLVSAFTHLNGLVGGQDAMILIDQAAPELL